MLLYFNADSDLGPHNNVRDAYQKQKHRMLWERRHGKVGTGMKDQNAL
jgi:NADH dehydrogenase (ubiquinone) 1 beta subcomplex subunit 10